MQLSGVVWLSGVVKLSRCVVVLFPCWELLLCGCRGCVGVVILCGCWELLLCGCRGCVGVVILCGCWELLLCGCRDLCLIDHQGLLVWLPGDFCTAIGNCFRADVRRCVCAIVGSCFCAAVEKTCLYINVTMLLHSLT